MYNYTSLITIISRVTDPRIDRTKLHSLTDILMIAICAAMCGMTGWEEIQAFGEAKEEWFRKFIPLANGIPSHDTFRRVFERIDPKQLENVLLDWTKTLNICLEGKIVAIDGKTLRASFDKSKGIKALHTISAWVAEDKLVLGQCNVDSKENEITKVPDLLNILEIKKAIVTIDAIGCQKNITRIITEEKKADYVIALKKNQPDLYNEVAALFKVADKDNQIETDVWESLDKGHGRLESRTCTCIEATPWLEHVLQDWHNLQTVVRVVSVCERKGERSEQTRYFISSLPANAKTIGKAVRDHWSIENTLHWSLDVVMKEDSIHISKDNSPRNLAVIRRIAFSLAKARTPQKMTTKRAQLKAILSQQFANEHFLKD